MNAGEYGEDFLFDLNAADLLKPRSAQDDSGVLGASSFGCREQMRRVLTKSPKTDSPSKMPALIGSYVDAGLKEARHTANPNLLLDAELDFVMPNGIKIMVHPDEIDPDEPSVTDYKTKNGLAAIRRGFTEQRYRFQRHLQYAAAHQNTLVPLEGITRNIFIDRSGKDPDAHVEQEPFSPQVIAEADDFLSDVLYAIDNDETAEKDTPRYLCQIGCPWFTACRGAEIQLDRITDPKIAGLVAGYYEAKKNRDESAQLMAELRDAGLEGLNGVTASHRVTSTFINPVNKLPYTKMSVEAL